MEKIFKLDALSPKIFFFIALNDLLDTAAQVLIKKGVDHPLSFGAHDCIFFWIGLVIYLFNFFLWMKILSKVDLSVALPLVSSSYILIPLAAIFFLHEFISPLRWLGLISIVLGIYFIAKTKAATDA